MRSLSKDKLVVVVSHDREFAAEYADGVIEFADGRVISDTASAKAEGAAENGATEVKEKAGKRSMGIGARARLSGMGLKKHPVRMVFTILLSMICFALVGFTDAFGCYDTNEVIYNSMRDAGFNYIGYALDSVSYNFNFAEGYWSDADEAEFRKRTGAEQIDYVRKVLNDSIFPNDEKHSEATGWGEEPDAIVSVILAVLLFGFGTMGFNIFLNTKLLLPISLLRVGIRQIAIILALSVGVAFAATFIPCYRNSCKKPIDVIKDL